MPTTGVQWAMFLFFATGAMGGIVYLVQQVTELVGAAVSARARSRME